MLGRMFGHEFHALLIFQKFLIADDFAALFGFWPLNPRGTGTQVTPRPLVSCQVSWGRGGAPSLASWPRWFCHRRRRMGTRTSCDGSLPFGLEVGG